MLFHIIAIFIWYDIFKSLPNWDFLIEDDIIEKYIYLERVHLRVQRMSLKVTITFIHYELEVTGSKHKNNLSTQGKVASI